MIKINIKILFKNYNLSYHDKLYNDKNQRLLGEISYEDETIKIIKGISESETKSVIMHEVLHGIENMFNMDLTEDEIDNLSHGLTTVLLENPELVKLFIKEVN